MERDNLILENGKSKKVVKNKPNKFNNLLKSIKPKEETVLNERVKITDKNIKINESVNDMINHIDKMLDE